jgi:hypothetical protein
MLARTGKFQQGVPHRPQACNIYLADADLLTSRNA